MLSSRDDSVLSLVWRDERDVLMLSAFHDDSMVGRSRRSRAAVGGVENIEKPCVVDEYNKFMGGVDKSKLIKAMYRLGGRPWVHGSTFIHGRIRVCTFI